MAKTKISEFSSTPGNNTDIDSINIAEGCAPSGINDAIRELMAQLKDFQTGAAGDSFNGPIGTTTAAAGAFTTLTASSTATLNTLASSGATLTGGTINNMAIGGTTAAAGSFTTLTTSGAVTHNAGTANSVAFLNGSKVLTTGSALTFDGSGKLALGNVAHTSFIPTTAISLGNSGENAEIRMGQQDTKALISKWVYNATVGSAYGALETYGQTNYIQFGASDFRWQVASSEQMRLTSTGLGIGTSSPAYKLDVRGVAAAGNGTITSAISYDSGGLVGTISNHSFGILTNSIVVARFDTSGNLGLGVTPSAWQGSGPGQTALQTMSWAVSNDVNSSYQTNNAVYSAGAWRYISSKSSVMYQLDSASGNQSWYTAPSGTAGNAISFTQAMTLDASGNLAIGTTSASGTRLRVLNQTSISGRVQVAYFGGASSWSVNGFEELGLGFSGIRSVYTGADDWALAFTTGTSNQYGAGTQAERVRINSVGDLLIGTTISAGNSGSVGARKGGTGELILLANNGGLFQQAVSSYFLVTTAGGNTSDATLKKNVQQLSGALAKVCAIRGVNFEFIAEQKSTPDNGVQVGVIAQEVEAQYPEIVVTNEDGIKSVRYEKLVAPLIEAIKEQQALITALTARITALESN